MHHRLSSPIQVLVRLIAASALAAAVALGLIAGSGPVFAQDATTPTVTAAVVRDVLGGGLPAAAPGKTLQLVRFTIAPGTTLPVHTHPGTQVAWLESGTLRYTVVQGEVPVTRVGPADGSPGPAETLTSGMTTGMGPGDSWVEPEGVAHFAQNAGTEPVVILVASLFTVGEPPSHAVAAATPTS